MKAILFVLIFLSFVSTAVAQKKSFAKITWPEVEYVDTYVLEVYKDKFMENRVFSKRVDGTSYRWVNPETGTYFFRVAAIDRWKQTGEFSPLSKIVLRLPTNRLERPILISPENGMELDQSQADETVNFTWNKASYAKKYRLIIAKDKSFSNIAYSLNTTSTRVEVLPGPNQLYGPHYWRVDAHVNNKSYRSSETRTINFTEKIDPFKTDDELELDEEENDEEAGDEEEDGEDQEEDEQSSEEGFNTFWSGNVGVGYTSFGYEQNPNSITVDETAVTLKASLALHLTDKLDIGGNMFGNVAVLSKTPETRAEATIMGINGRIGYTVAKVGDSSVFRVMPGYYYWQMSVADSSYGVDSLLGPQLFFLLAGKPSWSYWTYFKFSPISDSISSISFSNKELALGAGFGFPNSAWALTLDYSSISYATEDQAVNSDISLTSTTFGIQYSF